MTAGTWRWRNGSGLSWSPPTNGWRTRPGRAARSGIWPYSSPMPVARKRVPFTGAEKESLQVSLDRHLAAVEYGWFCTTFSRPTERLPFDENDEDADLRVRSDETTQDVLEFYARARASADQTIAELNLEDTGTAWFGDAVSLRWVLIHMIEETARHAGHVDIVRELIDGMTGDHNRT